MLKHRKSRKEDIRPFASQSFLLKAMVLNNSGQGRDFGYYYQKTSQSFLLKAMVLNPDILNLLNSKFDIIFVSILSTQGNGSKSEEGCTEDNIKCVIAHEATSQSFLIKGIMLNLYILVLTNLSKND